MLVLIALRAARVLRIHAGVTEPLHLANKKYECTVNSDFFGENFTFTNNVKTHICDVNTQPRQGCDLPISENRVISPIRDIFFSKLPSMRSFVKIKPSRKFPNLQY